MLRAFRTGVKHGDTMRISNLVSSGTALTALLWASIAGAYTTIDAETNASVYKVAGVTTQGYAGQSIAPVGDVDGDGSGDFLVGVPGLSTVRGSAYLFYGPLTADTDLSENGAWWASFTRPCTSSGCDLVGSSVAGAGDVNGDGFDDILIGAFNDGLGAGAV